MSHKAKVNLTKWRNLLQNVMENATKPKQEITLRICMVSLEKHSPSERAQIIMGWGFFNFLVHVGQLINRGVMLLMQSAKWEMTQ